jgi:group I intron endonuclease
MIGIYKITSPNNRVYIGQSVNIENRFLSYKNLHKRNNKLVILYRSFLKYGVENHIFEIIEECGIELLNERERYWQDHYNVLENGLNCRLTKTNDRSGKLGKETRDKIGLSKIGNKYFLNKKHSQETKNKISLGNTGKRHSEEVNKSKGRKGKVSPMKGVFSENHHRSVKVLQFDLNDNLIKEWNSLMDIKRELNFHIGNVSSCLKGNLKTYKKYKWKYKN